MTANEASPILNCNLGVYGSHRFGLCFAPVHAVFRGYAPVHAVFFAAVCCEETEGI
jgi:hypothetical protein